MEPPPKPTPASLFQVYLRLRPPIASTASTVSVPSTPSKSLYPTLPQLPERFLTVEPVGTDVAGDGTVEGNELSQDGRQHETQQKAEGQSDMPTHITIHPPSRGDSRKRAVEKFAFTRVFEESRSQLDLFNGIGVAGVVENVLKDGRDGLLATLGVTGSGKTHTILGSRSQRGLTQLSLELLFRSLDSKLVHPGLSPMLIPSLVATDASEAHIYGAGSFLDGIYGESLSSRAATPMTDITFASTPSRRHAIQRPSALPTLPDISGTVVSSSRNMEYAILVSMYEVYNDRIFDLLSYNRGGKENRRRPLLFKSTEGSPDRKLVAGLRKVVCGSYDEALMVLETGLMERRVAGTGSNSVSSRSHGFFCMEIKKRVKGGMASNWSSSNLTIVDLAGSERARNAKTAGATLAEAGKINESLMYLGQCLQMQSDSGDGSKPSIVPFRQCKLTELLFSNSFPSNASTTTNHLPQPQRAVMVVTADPHGDFNATSQILRYSALAREVTVPRIPSVTTLVFQGAGIPSSGKSSGRNTPEDSSVIRELEAELARLTDQVDVLALQVAEERVRRREAEAGWRRAEERMETLEQSVRDEVVADMEARAVTERRRWLEALGDAADRSEEHLDRKLDLLLQGSGYGNGPVQIYEDATATPPRAVSPSIANRNSELEEENRELRARMRRLEQDLHTRSPTKSTSKASPARSSALRNVMSAGDAPKMSLALGTSRLGPKTSMDDPFSSPPSSPLISCPAKSSPISSPVRPIAMAPTKSSSDRDSEEIVQADNHGIEGCGLPEEESSIFDPASEDKENTPLAATLAATQALAVLSLEGLSEDDSAVERELQALEHDVVQQAKAQQGGNTPAPSRRTTRSSTRGVQHSEGSTANKENGSPTKPAPCSELDSSVLNPSRQLTTAPAQASPAKATRQSPRKKSSMTAPAPMPTRSSPRKKSSVAHPLAELCVENSINASRDSISTRRSGSLMPHGGKLTGMEDSWSRGSLSALDDSEADGSGNWVVYE